LLPIFDEFFKVKISDSLDHSEIERDYKWADTIWLEWAGKLSIDISNRKKEKKIILRLHSYEYFCGFYSQINWNNIDDLIFIGENIRDYVIDKNFKKKFKTNIHVFHNFVNTNKFTLKKDSTNKSLAFISTLRHCKNIPFLLQCFVNLLLKDPYFTLHIAGDYQDWKSPHIQMENTEISHYIHHLINELNLNDKIFFYGNIDNVNNWLEDKSYIISTSLREGMPINILEGMSKGLMPVVHNFPGARDFYPNEYIFNTLDEFISIIMKLKLEPSLYRSIVVDNYSIEIMKKNYTKFFNSILN